jgi:hypothetical protein
MAKHMAGTVTGTAPVMAVCGRIFNTIDDLVFDDRQALWSGCLDAPDRLLSGSCRNFKTSYGEWMVYGSFDFRALSAWH